MTVNYTTIILKFADQGEKTGWTYIEVPLDVADQLKPGSKKSFRVKGILDGFEISGIALLPMGHGNFIMALNADIRRGIRKTAGATLSVKLEYDPDFKIGVPDDLQECLDAEPEAYEFFMSLTQGHRDYFAKWIESAKTEPTRVKRIVNTVNAMVKRMDYGQMIRALKAEK